MIFFSKFTSGIPSVIIYGISSTVPFGSISDSFPLSRDFFEILFWGFLSGFFKRYLQVYFQHFSLVIFVNAFKNISSGINPGTSLGIFLGTLVDCPRIFSIIRSEISGCIHPRLYLGFCFSNIIVSFH